MELQFAHCRSMHTVSCTLPVSGICWLCPYDSCDCTGAHMGFLFCSVANGMCDRPTSHSDTCLPLTASGLFRFPPSRMAWHVDPSEFPIHPPAPPPPRLLSKHHQRHRKRRFRMVVVLGQDEVTARGTLGRQPFSTRDVSPRPQGVSGTKVRTHSAAQHCRTLDSVDLHHSFSYSVRGTTMNLSPRGKGPTTTPSAMSTIDRLYFRGYPGKRRDIQDCRTGNGNLS